MRDNDERRFSVWQQDEPKQVAQHMPMAQRGEALRQHRLSPYGETLPTPVAVGLTKQTSMHLKQE